MTVSAAPSIFDVFNARQLKPQEVAKTFVPPLYFQNLSKQTHSLIVGPRGSGKTTLLKMLHPAALEAWQHESANEFRRGINFTGVFIATDLNWSEQVKALGDGLLDSETHTKFARSVFTTQILRSLIESMSHRAGLFGPAPVAEHRRVKLTESDQQIIAKELAATWRLERAIPSLDGLQLSLSRRLSEISLLASQEGSRGSDGRNERIAQMQFLHLNFLTAAAHAVELFNARCDERGARWALLFDELELAPQWIRATLFSFLRSVDDRFLFKLSMSPYSVDLPAEIDQINRPGERQDYEPIRLWYVNKEQGYPFCRDLLAGMLDARHFPPHIPDEVFGISEFSTSQDEWRDTGTAYRPDSVLGLKFKALATRDVSFRRYLAHHDIDLAKLNEVTGEQRAADIRKIRSIVALRLYFKGEGKSIFKQRVQGRRSRKNPAVYGGAHSLFAMVEGNPRWFIGIVGQLLSKWKPSRGSIPRAAQVRQVLDAADIFRAMLNTIPVGSERETGRGLLALIDPIGDFFAHAAIDGEFDPDPPCSFFVDSTTTEEEIKALGRALNAGAIVYAPNEGSHSVLSTLRERRFRLSYMLAPHYLTPLVLGRAISLRSILGEQRTKGRAAPRYPTLFTTQERGAQ